jgi:hypothetical protein
MRTSLLIALVLAALGMPSVVRAQKPFRGAEYRTIGTMTYGRFETRMKSAHVSGMLSSFFTYYDPASPWNEIDVEIMGRFANEIQFNTIVPANGSNHVQRQVVPFSPHAAFHVIGFEWTPDYVAWRVDGEEVYRQTGGHIAQLVEPQKLMMNIWQPADTGWAGPFSPLNLPVYAYYDWVKYYAYTPGVGDNFTLQWTDNFDTFDAARWQKATHTWDGNNAQFVTDNAVLKDGYLILCLTSYIFAGYSGGAIADQDVDPPYLIWARAYDSTIVVRFSEPVDRATAENGANYSGSGVIVTNAKLRGDGRTVDLSVRGMSFTSPFPLAVQDVRDTVAAPNAMGPTTTQVLMPLTLPIKIDVGGQGASGYLHDSVWTVTKNYGGVGGRVSTVSQSQSITGTSEPDVYRTSVHGLSGYTVRLPNGRYNVTLKMMEDRYSASGSRVFDAKVNGVPLFTGLDLFHQVGRFAAYEVTADSVEVNDNLLDIWMGSTVDSTTLSGITIERISGLTGIHHPPEEVPQWEFSIYPNPLNGSAVIRFSLPSSGRVGLSVYDVLGRLVAMSDLGAMSAGTHAYRWRDGGLASGSYFLTLRGAGHQTTRRLVITR